MQVKMSHAVDVSDFGSTKCGSFSFGELNTEGVRHRLTVGAGDCCNSVTNPGAPGVSNAGLQVEPAHSLPSKNSPIHIFIQGMRQGAVPDSAADLRPLRAKKWSN